MSFTMISSLLLHVLNVTTIFLKESLQTQCLVISRMSSSTMEQVMVAPTVFSNGGNRVINYIPPNAGWMAGP